MLDTFVIANREELIRRCRARVGARSMPAPTAAELESGIPQFLDQLVEALQHRREPHLAIDRSAAQHGRDLQGQGFTVSQVVHDYGDVCQSITDLAVETGVPISVADFRTLNLCLDDAIASAVTEFAREGADTALDDAAGHEQRFGFFVHEARNLIGAASMAFEVLNDGDVGVKGSTGRVLQRSLDGLRDLIARSVAEVRQGHRVRERVHVVVAELLDDLTPAAEQEAASHGVRLTVQRGEAGVAVCADRRILTAVVVNLLQNGFKFTRPGTSVKVSVTAVEERVLIEVADECGGIAEGVTPALFRPFEQRHADRTGLGLGLAFSKWGAEINDGSISVRSVPTLGCVFTVDLPRVPAPDGNRPANSAQG